jgi:hypothetical protein
MAAALSKLFRQGLEGGRLKAVQFNDYVQGLQHLQGFNGKTSGSRQDFTGRRGGDRRNQEYVKLFAGLVPAE